MANCLNDPKYYNTWSYNNGLYALITPEIFPDRQPRVYLGAYEQLVNPDNPNEVTDLTSEVLTKAGFKKKQLFSVPFSFDSENAANYFASLVLESIQKETLSPNTPQENKPAFSDNLENKITRFVEMIKNSPLVSSFQAEYITLGISSGEITLAAIAVLMGCIEDRIQEDVFNEAKRALKKVLEKEGVSLNSYKRTRRYNPHKGREYEYEVNCNSRGEKSESLEVIMFLGPKIEVDPNLPEITGIEDMPDKYFDYPRIVFYYKKISPDENWKFSGVHVGILGSTMGVRRFVDMLKDGEGVRKYLVDNRVKIKDLIWQLDEYLEPKKSTF